MNNFILAQVFGLLGAISMILSNWQNTRKKVLCFLLLDSIFYFIQYLLLEALSGALTNIIGIIRILIFNYKDKYKIQNNKLLLHIIILLYIIVGIITYDNGASIFPIIASIVYSIVLWQDDIKKIRLGTFIMILSWLIYNIAVNAYIGIIIEALLLVSSLLSIIKLDILKNKNIKQIDKIIKQ